MSANHYKILLFGPGAADASVVTAFADRFDVALIKLGEGFASFDASAAQPISREQRSKLMDESEGLHLDAFILADSIWNTPHKLWVFDVDSTLIQAEIIDELAGLAGVREEVSKVTERAMRGELDFREALANRTSLLRGLGEEQIMKLHETVLLSEGAENLVRGLKAHGCKTAMVSGGFGFYGRHLRDRLGFDYMFTNELEIRDGVLTGKLAAEVVDSKVKADSLKAVAEKEGIPLDQVVAVGDGANDLPMLALAGVGVAYRAKPIVRAAAEYRLNFAPLDSLLHLLR